MNIEPVYDVIFLNIVKKLGDRILEHYVLDLRQYVFKR
jgi:hypothetical protein